MACDVRCGCACRSHRRNRPMVPSSTNRWNRFDLRAHLSGFGDPFDWPSRTSAVRSWWWRRPATSSRSLRTSVSRPRVGEFSSSAVTAMVVAVRADRRRSGAAQLVTESLFAMMQSEGTRSVQWLVHPSNLASVAFSRSCSHRPIRPIRPRIGRTPPSRSPSEPSDRAGSSKNPSKKFLNTGWYRTAPAGLEKRESPARWHRMARAGRSGLDS
jgi:hypothetical protein